MSAPTAGDGGATHGAAAPAAALAGDDDPVSARDAGRGTLPPPEFFDRPAPASVGELILEDMQAGAPLSRHSGTRAELAFLTARLESIREEQDTAAERETCIELARMLAHRGVDLDTAATLARRALALGDDSSLRAELAGWLVGLGEPALAALTLRGLRDGTRDDAPSMATLVRIAVLLARADDVAGAADALREAADLDPAESIACELLGTLAAWAPEDVAPDVAADAYLEAAQRRDTAGEKEAAFEDRLRAFEIAPEHEPAAQATAAMLTARSRAGAADEVMRAHAQAVRGKDEARAREVHRRRMIQALKDGDPARAVGAALDAGIEGRIDVDTDVKLEEVLAHAGLYELFAVRLELRAERRQGLARADEYQALAKLYAGPLASPDRALEAWIETLAADPENASALDALRDQATSMHDPAPLLEALLRVASAGSASPAGASASAPVAVGRRGSAAREHPVALRAALVRELCTLAEDRLADAALASWGHNRLAALGVDVEASANAVERLLPRVRAQDDMLATARRSLEANGPTRVETLRRLAGFLRGRPDEAAAYRDVLGELARAQPGEHTHQLAFERACARLADPEPLEALLRERLETTLPRAALVRDRLLLATLHRRRGDDAEALELAKVLLEQAPGHRGAASVVLVLASRCGDDRLRAEALVQLAGPLWANLKAVLLAVAAELLAGVAPSAPAEQSLELRETARRLAQQAIEADPTCARAVATLAAIVGNLRDSAQLTAPPVADRLGAAALERAMGVVIPRGAHCEALAASLEALGEMPLALAWTQRWLALRPGCPHAIADLIRRAARARDGGRLSDALAWVLAQPEPLRELADSFVTALQVLFQVDPERACAVGRRALDVFGPRNRPLRDELLALADRAGDAALAIAVLERALASDANESRPPLLLDLFTRRLRAADWDGAAHELARAAEQGADANIILEHVAEVERAVRDREAVLGSDGQVALAGARAFASTALAERPDSKPTEVDAAKLARDPARSAERRTAQQRAATAWRELGGLRWDLADDPRGAEQAFYFASTLGGEDGLRRYAVDLCEFAGVPDGMRLLHARADTLAAQGAARDRAAVFIEIANRAAAVGLNDEALAAAARAIEIDPSRADAVALVERSAGAPGGLATLDRTYDLLAGAALGRYGRRAAHYRGARQLERRGAAALALRHAIACFEAVPTEGTAYVLLARLAERAGDASEAVRAIERVAQSGVPEVRSAWLKRAADLAGTSSDGQETRFDVLLRALHVRPDAGVVEQIVHVARHLAGAGGDEDMIRMRLSRALRAVLPRLEGPDGARTAIALARAALSGFADAGLATAALERAMAVDGDVDEYLTLGAHLDALVAQGEALTRFLDLVGAEVERPYASLGPALLRLASAAAATAGDARRAAALLVQAARRAPEDDALVHAADVAVREIGDEALLRSLDDALPAARRTEALLHLAAQHEREGRDAEAIAALERAIDSGKLGADERDRAVLRVRHLLGVTGRSTDVEALLRREVARPEAAQVQRTKLARDLSAQLAARGDWEGALDVLAELTQRVPPDRALLVEVHRLARRTGDRARQAEVLRRLADMAEDPASRLAALRELLPVARDLGDRGGFVAACDAVLRIDPADRAALEGLEQDASERADHEGLAALLARRITAAPSGDARRALRLRRAAVLEQRLGRLDEACVELETLLSEVPGDRSAYRFLADVRERLGTPLSAAALWRRLGELSTGNDEKGEYGLRAASSYLAGGDLAAAREAMDEVAGVAPREALIELRVELARRDGDTRALSEALEQLAAISTASEERLGEILLEASRAASAIGDEAAALERARRAAKLAPLNADAVLEARRLEYLARGTGTPRQAQAAAQELGAIAEGLDEERLELLAFLLAEELDVIQGGGAGMRELSRRHAEIGPRPLIALGMAERLSMRRSFGAALPLFERALAGDLRGLRGRGRVALAAAEAAVNAGELDAAARFLEEAAVAPETRPLATRRQLELTALRGEPVAAEHALAELAERTTGLDRARALAQLARVIVSVPDHGRADEVRDILDRARALAGPDRALAEQIAEELARLDAPKSRREPPPLPGTPVTPLPDAPQPPPSEGRRHDIDATEDSAPMPPPSVPPPEPDPEDLDDDDDGPPARIWQSPSPSRPPPPMSNPLPLVATPAPTPTPTPTAPSATQVAGAMWEAPRSTSPAVPTSSAAAWRGSPSSSQHSMPATSAGPVPISVPLSSTPFASSGRDPVSVEAVTSSGPLGPESLPSSVKVFSDVERELIDQLRGGSVDAGDRLVGIWGEHAPDRAHDLLAVRKQQVALRPGDRVTLERARLAALADGNLAYERALAHVLNCFTAEAPPVSPRVDNQREATPELVSSLLFRKGERAVNEALALAWETGMFRRDANHYRLTGLERVQLGAATPVGEAYTGVARLLGAVRTPLFHPRGPGAPGTQVALLWPPAVILTGDVREHSSQLDYLIGAALASAMPEHALVAAWPEETVRTLLSALLAAFGPVDATETRPHGGHPESVAKLERDLWQLVPPRAARRLAEICADTAGLKYALAMKEMRRAVRRAGLLACGDLAVAVRQTVAELSLPLTLPLEDPQGLARACELHQEIADLVRLATRSEYAEIRWRQPSGSDSRRTEGGTRGSRRDP